MAKKIIVLVIIVLIFVAGGFFYWWQNPQLTWLGKAQVGIIPEEETKEEVGQELAGEEVEIIEEELDIEPASEPEPTQSLTLEELQVMLDDIARQIDMLTQEVAKLIEEGLEEEEKEEKEFAGCQENQLNINIALIEGLEELYRIGPVLAQKIVEERQKELFYTLDELTRVRGIGEKTVAGIKEQGIACAGLLEEGAASLALEQDDEEEEDVEEDICWVNINTALVEELQKITGVGPVIAQRIIETRPFSSLSDLLRVSGIGETTLQKIIAQGCAYASGYIGSGGGAAAAPPTSSPSPISYPKIIISEVQIAGDDTNHDFIELYNPDNSDADISGYKLRKRTSTGNESSIRVLPSGSLISARGYYLWASSKDENYPFLISADASTTQTLASNNSIALLAPDNTTISALSWASSTNPFMETSPFPENPGENESLGRIWLEEIEEYKNTGDNSVDFEIQTSTPRAQNQTPEPVVEYTLTIEIIGEGTTTPAFGNSTYQENEEVIVTAYPEEGWKFIDWTGSATSEEAIITIIMDEDKSIIANFEKEESEPPMNFLLNEFFEEWDNELPLYWKYSTSTRLEVYQSVEVFRGEYSLGIKHDLVVPREIEQYISHSEADGVVVTYYGELWVKGSGWIQIGIKRPGYIYAHSDWVRLEGADWVKLELEKIKDDREGTDLGFRIRSSAKEQIDGAGGIDVDLLIGAAWLSNAPPPDEWLD